MGAALRGVWVQAAMPSGGCSYTQGARVILASTVPAPAERKGREEAIAQVRRPCDAGSVRSIASAPGGFVCTQKTIVAGSVIVRGELLIVFTTVGSDQVQITEARAMLARLLAGRV